MDGLACRATAYVCHDASGLLRDRQPGIRGSFDRRRPVLREGMCHRCWTRSPTRPITQAENLLSALDDPQGWLVSFANFAAERHCVAPSCVMVTAVGQLLRDGQPSQPQALLERARRPGRSAGPLARTLEEFTG